jgi:hypothetical protein
MRSELVTQLHHNAHRSQPHQFAREERGGEEQISRGERREEGKSR